MDANMRLFLYLLLTALGFCSGFINDSNNLFIHLKSEGKLTIRKYIHAKLALEELYR